MGNHRTHACTKGVASDSKQFVEHIPEDGIAIELTGDPDEMSGGILAVGVLVRQDGAVDDIRRNPCVIDQPCYGREVPYFLGPGKVVTAVAFERINQVFAHRSHFGIVEFQFRHGGGEVGGNGMAGNLDEGHSAVKQQA